MRIGLAAGVLVALLSIDTGLSQSSTFSYQGRLLDKGRLANGSYDFQFRLADAPTNGNYVGPTLNLNPVAVTNGVFTVTLDFGFDVFDGSSRYLEPGVRTNGSLADYTILQPLQPITVAPYAMLATTATAAGVASNLVDGAVLTNVTIAGGGIQSGTITSQQIDPATDAAYRALDTNGVMALIASAFSTNGSYAGDLLGSALAPYATTNALDQAMAEAARTDRENTFTASQFFLGDYNQVRGAYLDFHRPAVYSPSAVRFFRDNDTNSSHNVEVGMDWVLGGYYWCVYDSLLNSDIFRIGVDPPWGGLVSIGNDGLVLGHQFSIHDYLNHGISNSLEILSAQDGVIVNSWSRCADAFTIQRDGLDLRHWFRWYQGDGTHDWRVGMESNYDLAFYAGTGNPTSPIEPGVKILNLSAAAAAFGVPLVGDGSGLTNIWPSFLPSDTLAPLGGYSTWSVSNTYSGWLGVCFVAGQDDMLLKALARYSPGGLTNKQHQILVLNADFTTNGCVTLPRTHKSGDFVWANCNIMVNAGTTNYLITDTGDGDYYLDVGGPAGWDANIESTCSCSGSAGQQTLGAANAMYGALNFVR